MAAHTVLVVDDHEDVLVTLEFALRAEGFQVEIATNGRDALTRLDQGLQPCLIVLDLFMPIMDGFEFRRLQLDRAELAGIPVVAFSAGTESREVRNLGFAAVIPKPCDPVELVRLARSLCSHARGGP